jgi:hypothetical protein
MTNHTVNNIAYYFNSFSFKKSKFAPTHFKGYSQGCEKGIFLLFVNFSNHYFLSRCGEPVQWLSERNKNGNKKYPACSSARANFKKNSSQYY